MDDHRTIGLNFVVTTLMSRIFFASTCDPFFAGRFLSSHFYGRKKLIANMLINPVARTFSSVAAIGRHERRTAGNVPSSRCVTGAARESNGFGDDVKPPPPNNAPGIQLGRPRSMDGDDAPCYVRVVYYGIIIMVRYNHDDENV